MSVLALDATENSLSKLYDRDYKYDILFMTPESLTKELFMNKIYEMKDEFVGIVIDEAHLYCNYQESMNAQMLEALSSYFDYVVGLTATPISSKLKQLSSVLRIVNPYVFIDHRKTMEYINSESDYIKCTVINRSRDKNLHNGILVPIPPMEHQIGAKRRDELLVKGAKGLVQHAYLLKILEMTGDKKALVYVNRKEIYSALMERMKQYNIPCAMINGDTKLKDQTKILEEFSQDKYKVLFTNKTTSLDIECDIVIFYELVIEVQQFVGRSARGIEAKRKDVYFLVTEDTFEEDYFWDTIYNRMIQIKSVFKIKEKEVQIKDRLIEDDSYSTYLEQLEYNLEVTESKRGDYFDKLTTRVINTMINDKLEYSDKLFEKITKYIHLDEFKMEYYVLMTLLSQVSEHNKTNRVLGIDVKVRIKCKSKNK